MIFNPTHPVRQISCLQELGKRFVERHLSALNHATVDLQFFGGFSDGQPFCKAGVENLKVLVQHGFHGLTQESNVLTHGYIFLVAVHADILAALFDEFATAQVETIIFADVLGVFQIGFAVADMAGLILVVFVSEGLALRFRKTVLIYFLYNFGVEFTMGLANILIAQCTVYFDLLAERGFGDGVIFFIFLLLKAGILADDNFCAGVNVLYNADNIDPLTVITCIVTSEYTLFRFCCHRLRPPSC